MRFVWLGKRHSQTLDMAPTPANMLRAERLMERVQREIEVNIFDYATAFPESDKAKKSGFAEAARNWLATVVAEKSTIQAYTGALEKIWIPAFGDRDLASIKPSEIKAIIAKRATEVTAQTINNSLIPLRGVFEAAIDDGALDRSPMTRIKNRKHQAPLPDPFVPAERDRIIEYMQERYDPQIANWYEFAFGTGLRPSEQIAVRWGDVDFGRRTIRIQRARVRHVVKGTKTNSARDVDLTDRMIAVLNRQKAHTFMRGFESPIFINPVTGTPWPDVQDQRKLYFQPALRALGMRMRVAYQTRHTYATTALMAGVNPAYIARQLGHTNPAMVFKHYSKWIDGADGGVEARKLNALYV